MRKIVISLLLLALSIGTFSCGGGAGSPNSPSGENHGTPSVVQLLPSNSVAQTNSAITLHAKVLDGNGAPVANVAVRFINISPIGVLMNEKSVPLTNPVVKTNGKGIATVRLLSTVEGFATVQAEVNKGVGIVRDKKTVFFAVNINLQPFIVLDVDSNGNGIFNEPDDFKLFNPTNN
jgi:hypothetical protein